MTIREAYDIFSSIYDDIRDEGIHIALFNRHINNAQYAILKNHFYADQDVSKRTEYHQPRTAYSQTQYKDEDFNDLIEKVTIATDANGEILISDIEANFPTETIQGEDGQYETRNCQLFHIASCKRDGRKVVWQRHNDHSVDEENPFKMPSARFPKYRHFANKLVFLPAGEATIEMAVVRTPRHVWLDPFGNLANNIDPELNDILMFDVIFRALTFAGVNIREGQLRDYVEREETKL